MAACIALFVAPSGCDRAGRKHSSLWESSATREKNQRNWDEIRGNARLQVAERHLRGGRFADARRELDAVLQSSPQSASAYVLSARIELEQGQLAKARLSIRKAAEFGEDPEIDYLAGIIAERYDDPKSALEHFERAAGAAPLVVDYILAQAETLVALGRPVDAMELVESRIADFDRCGPLRSLSVRIMRSLGLRGPAIERARDAVRLFPDDFEATAELGAVLAWAGKPNDTIEVLEPIADAAIRRLQAAQVNTPETAPARKALDADVEPTGDAPGAVLMNLARAYADVRRSADALKTLNKLTAQSPNDAAAWLLYARIAVEAGNLKVATDALVRANSGSGAQTEVHLLAAYVALKRGRPDECAEHARASLAIDDRTLEAYLLLGQSAEATGNIDEARAAYSEAIALAPDSSTARAMLYGVMSPSDTGTQNAREGR